MLETKGKVEREDGRLGRNGLNRSLPSMENNISANDATTINFSTASSGHNNNGGIKKCDDPAARRIKWVQLGNGSCVSDPRCKPIAAFFQRPPASA